MEHFNIITTLIIMVVLIYAVVKQFMAKPIKWFGFLIFPMLALYEAYHSYTAAAVTAYQDVECAVMITLALIAAVIQALFTEVFYKDSQLPPFLCYQKRRGFFYYYSITSNSTTVSPSRY